MTSPQLGYLYFLSKYLKEQKPDVKIWGVDTYGSVFKKYHETGHMLTVAYQPNHRYRKDWRLLLKESKDSWLATIHFFDRHLKKR